MRETCVICNKEIEGFVVRDPEGKAYHPGCVPKEFRVQAESERKASRVGREPVRMQRKRLALQAKINRQFARWFKAMNEMALAGKEVVGACSTLEADHKQTEWVDHFLASHGVKIQDAILIQDPEAKASAAAAEATEDVQA